MIINKTMNSRFNQNNKKGSVRTLENHLHKFVDFSKKTDGYEFSEECMETCALFGLEGVNYKFVFKVDKGTTLYIDNIIYSVEK